MKVPFKLVGLRTKQFAIISNIKDSSSFNVKSSFEFGFNAEDSLIKSVSSFIYEQSDSPLLKLEVEGIFQIDSSCWANWTKGTTCTIPVGLLQHLATIVVGASRGILLEKTASTPYSSHFLPLLDLTKVITEAAVINLSPEGQK